MQVESEKFTSLKGHVADGCVILTPSGREYTLRNRMGGWMIFDQDGSPISGLLAGAFDVEYFVVNGLASH